MTLVFDPPFTILEGDKITIRGLGVVVVTLPEMVRPVTMLALIPVLFGPTTTPLAPANALVKWLVLVVV